jgi:hypothetical protein
MKMSRRVVTCGQFRVFINDSRYKTVRKEWALL